MESLQGLESSRASLLNLPREELLRRARATIALHKRKEQARLKDYVPHVGQLPFHLSGKKYRWVFGGNRSGKTEEGAAEMVIRATGRLPDSLREDYPYRIPLPSDNWVVSLDFPNSRDVAEKKILKYLNPKDIRKHYKTDRIIELIVGSVIGFKSCDSGAAKFQGPAKDNIWFDEEPTYDVYKECLMRVMDRGGLIWSTMTPTLGLSWTYNEIIEGEDADTFISFMDLDQNPYISAQEKMKILKKFTGEELKMRKSGKFIALGGLIYPMWDPNRHIIKEETGFNNCSIYLGIDPGIAHPTACIWAKVTRDGQKVLYREYRESGRSAEENAEAIAKLTVENPSEKRRFVTAVIDPSSEAKNPITKTSVLKEYQKVFLKYGLHLRVGDNKVETRLNATRTSLSTSPPSTVIQDSLRKFQQEIRTYTWVTIRGREGMTIQERPKKTGDDLMNAWQYIEALGARYIDPITMYGRTEPTGVQNEVTGY